MENKRLAIISYDMKAAEFHDKQIDSLFGENVIVEKYSFYDRNFEEGIMADMVLVSSYIIFEAVKKYVRNNCKIIIIKRTLSKAGLDKIMNLPEGTKAMLVDVSHEIAMEMVSTIYQLGVSHIKLIPVYPGMEEVPDLDIAITPGESKHVSESVKRIIDIGYSLLDINTVLDIGVELDLEHMLQKQNIRQSFKEMVTGNFGLVEVLGKTNRFESQIDILLQILDDGIIGINSEGVIYSYNESAEEIIGYKKQEAIGNNGLKLLPQIPFAHVLEASESVKEKLIVINDYDVVVTVDPIIHTGRLYGAVATIKKFSDIEKKQHKLRAQLIGKGHRAKYSFEDILGKSRSINKCKDIAMRMAKSDSSIIISGESGTGKELFAQAIHNSSKRKNYQFVAVNCGALPESLLESELFGYEEGAFTGARKGGKSGLFELAHKGTLFFDEIGEMPLTLQMRLLRVLQEREVMRIGGDSVINVDVRIIAATNRDLKQLVKQGKFRRDLYFRLNVLPLKIPPLRERREDILPLITQIKKEFNSNFDLTPQAIEIFLDHSWEGNVRELRNYIEYLANLGQKEIDVKDLPFDSEKLCDDSVLDEDDRTLLERFQFTIGKHIDKYIFVLEELEKSYIDKKRTGRRSICKSADQKGIFLSEQEIRGILINLESFSMVDISRGRGGTKITDFGRRTLQYFKMG